jgi:hypothetical protein
VHFRKSAQRGGARRVVVVTGADAFDKMWEDIARQELQVNDRRLEFTYLSGLPLGRLLEEVAHLPRDTIVLFLTVMRDGTGELFTPRDVAEKVATDSGAPTYSVFPSYFGRGIVGGYMNSFEAFGEQTAAIALRLLSGERPEHMGAALGPEGSYVADARQLQRWSPDKSRLPAGSVVRFRGPSVWVAYRWHIAAAALAIVLQSLLIVALILQRWQTSDCGGRSAAPAHRVGARFPSRNARGVERVHRSRGEPAAGRDIEQRGCRGVAARRRAAPSWRTQGGYCSI